MIYREHPVCASLAGWVDCVWTMRLGSQETLTHRVLPDGCMDLLFELAGPGTGEVVGAMTAPLEVRPPQGSHFVGLRFLPGRAGRFIDLPVSVITDAMVPLAEVWKPQCDLAERLGECFNSNAQVRLLESVLLRKLADSSMDRNAPLRFTRAAVHRIEEAKGNLSIEALAAGLGCSRQYLARNFAETVGLSPKQLARIVRLRHFIAGSGEISLAQTAANLGYTDEAHLSRECRLLAGQTPAELRASGSMSPH